MHQQNQQLIQALHDCAMECDHCFNACFQEQDVKMMARCIQLDRACAEICHLTASFSASGSEMLSTMLKACAEACEMCAEECAKHEMDHCKRCAEACRKCAEACRNAA
jgi:hypothetical protein